MGSRSNIKQEHSVIVIVLSGIYFFIPVKQSFFELRDDDMILYPILYVERHFIIFYRRVFA